MSSFQLQLTERIAEAIGWKIWMNETSGKTENLVVWNKGETFASLGIGHFIWYQAGQEGPFQESFPALLRFLKDSDIMLPVWLEEIPDCPWNTELAFLEQQNSQKMRELRTLLARTMPQQVKFILQRLEAALPKILVTLENEHDREHVRTQFYRVAGVPRGVYALADYVNFKGEGISPQERYKDQGWGLLQVLQHTSGDTSTPVLEFADAAEYVLTRRVQNAPEERSEFEIRWLPGWKARIDTYRREL